MTAITKKAVITVRAVITAPVEKVYNTMLDEKKYNEWTVEFNPTL